MLNTLGNTFSWISYFCSAPIPDECRLYYILLFLVIMAATSLCNMGRAEDMRLPLSELFPEKSSIGYRDWCILHLLAAAKKMLNQRFLQCHAMPSPSSPRTSSSLTSFSIRIACQSLEAKYTLDCVSRSRRAVVGSLGISIASFNSLFIVSSVCSNFFNFSVRLRLHMNIFVYPRGDIYKRVWPYRASFPIILCSHQLRGFFAPLHLSFDSFLLHSFIGRKLW